MKAAVCALLCGALLVASVSASVTVAQKMRARVLGPDGAGCTSRGGVCTSGSCAGSFVKGLCPGAPVCCVPNGAAAPAPITAAAPSPCTARGGVCATGSCAGSWVSGLCPGTPVCCVPGAAGAAAAPSLASAPPSADAPICLTFDDGPFDNTIAILDMLESHKVKGTWFMNCHTGGSVAPTLKRLADGGHLLANHMCSHDIMAAGQYGKSYGAVMKQTDGQCLSGAGQANLFKQNVQGTIDLYTGVFKTLGRPLPPRAFQLHRFPGDGRFMNCLVNKLLDTSLVSVPGIHHLGWTYEIAPTGTFGHLKDSAGVPGLSSSYPYAPKAGAVVLAHDLHYRNGKLGLLEEWVKNQLAAGKRFGLPDPSGKCVSA